MTLDEVCLPEAQRWFATVVFVDVVGYVALMAEDEARTHPRWMQLLSAVVRPLATEMSGRIVKTLGDGVLAVFTETLDAVRWALELQRRVATSDKADAENDLPPIPLRIAIHQGFVIEADHDLYGNVVNTTARLQEHCTAGGVVVSAAVYGVVADALELKGRDLGLLTLRGVPNPYHVYSLPPDRPVRVRSGVRRGPVPSIAILPLRNSSESLDDRYFADGIVEDIILSLANLRELMVISRGSTLAFGAMAAPSDVGRDLAVRYVLSGSIRRTTTATRVGVQLYDVASGRVLWGTAVETPPDRVFDVQDDIVTQIVGGIAPHVRDAELSRALRKRPDNYTAYELTLRALDILDHLDPATYPQALTYLEQAMLIDPQSAMTVAWAARWHSVEVGQGWSPDPAASIRQAATLAARAIGLDPQNALALATYGHVQSFHLRDHDAGLAYLERALAASPSMALAWTLSAGTLAYVGRGNDAVRHAERALRLSPFDPGLYATYSFLSFAYFARGDYEQAARWSRRSMNERPLYTACLRMLAASLAILGRLEDARLVADQLLQLEPGFALEQYAATRLPFRPQELRGRFLHGLALAGLPK